MGLPAQTHVWLQVTLIQRCAGRREYLGFDGVLDANKLSCSGSKVHLCMVMISGCQLATRRQTLLVKALMTLPWQQQTTSTGTFCETYTEHFPVVPDLTEVCT